MVFGISPNKWLHDKVKKLNESVDNEIDVYAFIDKEYFRLLQISCIYVKLDKRNRLMSLIQWSFYVTVLFYHYILLTRSTILMMDINMVLFSQSTHFTLLVQLTTILIVWLQTRHRQITLFHKLLSVDFYDYQEPPAKGADALRNGMVRERRLLSAIPVGAALAAGGVLIIAPIVDRNAGLFDFEEMSKEFSTHMPYPYGKYPYQTIEGISYYLTLGGQLIIGLLLTIIIGSGGFIFLNLAQNVSLQLKLLENSMDQIETRAEFMYLRKCGKTRRDTPSLYNDHQFIYCYNKCLRKNYEHHQVIM
ncbi:Odorant receptor 13, partial [Halyomorpha halys]